MSCFAKVKLDPIPSLSDLRMLCRALEAYPGSDNQIDINYKKILNAPVKREFQSINGIFPRIVRQFHNL